MTPKPNLIDSFKVFIKDVYDLTGEVPLSITLTKNAFDSMVSDSMSSEDTKVHGKGEEAYAMQCLTPYSDQPILIVAGVLTQEWERMCDEQQERH